MKKYVFGFEKEWFSFPLSIDITRRHELVHAPFALSIHFLWWHFRYTFIKKDCNYYRW